MNVRARIASTANPKVKEWNLLKQKKERDRTGSFLIEDEHLIREAARAGCLQALLVPPGYPAALGCRDIFEVSLPVLEKLSDSASAARIIGIAVKPAPRPLGRRVIILDEIQDPGNVGTIIRLACALDYVTVVLSPGCADPYGPKAVRSTQGALFAENIRTAALEPVIASLEKQGIPVIGTVLAKDARPLDCFKAADEVALVFGNEGQGIRRDIADLCSDRLTIPMRQFESLNVAVAAGIIAYHFRRPISGAD